MNPNSEKFNRDHVKFFQAIAVVERLPLPKWVRVYLIRWISRHWNPWLFDQKAVQQYFQEELGLSLIESREHTTRWLLSYGQFAFDIFAYRTMDRQKMLSQVMIRNPEDFAALVKTGGLVLTYHSFHHHTLFVLLGIAGLEVNVVAAPESNAMNDSKMAEFSKLINRESAKYFRGGRYLFLNEKRKLIEGIKRALQSRLDRPKCVAIVNDNWDPNGRLAPFALFRRQIRVGSDVLRLALKQNPPIYLAMVYPDEKGRLILDCKKISASHGDHSVAVLQQYFEFLENIVRKSPWAWQGWGWYGFLDKNDGVDWHTGPSISISKS